jgi:hypothetical protein
MMHSGFRMLNIGILKEKGISIIVKVKERSQTVLDKWFS